MLRISFLRGVAEAGRTGTSRIHTPCRARPGGVRARRSSARHGGRGDVVARRALRLRRLQVGGGERSERGRAVRVAGRARDPRGSRANRARGGGEGRRAPGARGFVLPRRDRVRGRDRGDGARLGGAHDRRRGDVRDAPLAPRGDRGGGVRGRPGPRLRLRGRRRRGPRPDVRRGLAREVPRGHPGEDLGLPRGARSPGRRAPVPRRARRPRRPDGSHPPGGSGGVRGGSHETRRTPPRSPIARPPRSRATNSSARSRSSGSRPRSSTPSARRSRAARGTRWRRPTPPPTPPTPPTRSPPPSPPSASPAKTPRRSSSTREGPGSGPGLRAAVSSFSVSSSDRRGDAKKRRRRAARQIRAAAKEAASAALFLCERVLGLGGEEEEDRSSSLERSAKEGRGPLGPLDRAPDTTVPTVFDLLDESAAGESGAREAASLAFRGVVRPAEEIRRWALRGRESALKARKPTRAFVQGAFEAWIAGLARDIDRFAEDPERGLFAGAETLADLAETERRVTSEKKKTRGRGGARAPSLRGPFDGTERLRRGGLGRGVIGRRPR